MVILPIILVMKIVLFPDLEPIQVERFDDEFSCMEAASDIDSSTKLILELSCIVEI